MSTTVNTEDEALHALLSRTVGWHSKKVSSCFTECHAPETFASPPPPTCAPQQRNGEIHGVAVVPLFWFFGTPRKKLFLLGVDWDEGRPNPPESSVSGAEIDCLMSLTFRVRRDGEVVICVISGRAHTHASIKSSLHPPSLSNCSLLQSFPEISQTEQWRTAFVMKSMFHATSKSTFKCFLNSHDIEISP
ncbi:hypothetical protein BHE74_00056332 [Ensete ventricosum]|nr:hypothetical protein BHE74_00056332 [Ensete ventricosum]